MAEQALYHRVQHQLHICSHPAVVSAAKAAPAASCRFGIVLLQQLPHVSARPQRPKPGQAPKCRFARQQGPRAPVDRRGSLTQCGCPWRSNGAPLPPPANAVPQLWRLGALKLPSPPPPSVPRVLPLWRTAFLHAAGPLQPTTA
eukprot:scaffold223660_cov31-Tisochrysis_lutea.AAC.2